MTVKTLGVLLAVFVVSVGAYGLWYQRQHPRVVLSTGQVRVESKVRPGNPQTLKTRVVQFGTVKVEEIELPNGTWIDCAGDCRRAALDAGPDFWDAQARDRGR